MSTPPEDADMPNLSVPTESYAAPQTPEHSSLDLDPAVPEAHASGLAIIASKISPAVPGRSILSRPRLVDWFGHHAGARLLLVSAEAGYGKTTLLNEYALQTRDRCVWYRMETSDGDWITFLSYMVAALRDVWPGFGRSTEALLRNVAAMGSSREIVLAQFLADLGEVDDRRVAVILDDYHFVEHAPDVRMILSRLLERAPEAMYFILGGRGRPNLALGRLMAQGRVVELTIDDLRFTLEEIEQLFSTTYGQPLGLDACRVISERTEGWAASLQLVSASIAVSAPSEVAGFIHSLSGATGPIYDFLAEEVLTRLSPDVQQILMHASLVEGIQTQYVAAALAAGGRSVAPATIDRALDEAEGLGLLGSRQQAASGRRMHPLFREFLSIHLEREVNPPTIREMHLAIARLAEPVDWLMAARHFAYAQQANEGMRVLGSAASEALGTGAWGAAVEIVDLMPDTPPPAAVKVIQARALISEERPEAALDLLSGIDRAALTSEERGLVGLTSAAIHHMHGDGERLAAEVDLIAADPAMPPVLHEIAVTWRLLLDANSGGCISDAVQALRRLSVGQLQASLHYFAGVTLHNTAYAELARGNYGQARDLARKALEQLELTADGVGIGSSTQSIEADATAELGELEEGLRLVGASASGPGATADAVADAAYLNAVCGRTGKARSLLAKFDRGDSRWPQELGTEAQGCFARIALHISDDSLDGAAGEVARLLDLEPQAIDDRSRAAVCAANMAVIRRASDAPQRTREALATASAQNAWRWMARARILDAIVKRDGDSLALWIAETENESAVAVLELADAIATAVGTFASLPEALERSIIREPARWMAALRRQVRSGPSDDAAAAASLIARFGTADDADVLREFDRLPSHKSRKRGLTTQLIRRVSPTVRLHDLGLTSYQIGERHVSLTETRRKPAALMLYLVTRPGLAATREQVMDSLWPDQSPRSAGNSLHQTLFFLRRSIEPWYEDGSTAEYVQMESDLVRLDSDLFQVDSVAFARQAASISATATAGSRGPELLALYNGHFAPEFEYEEWADSWRTHLHTTYLHLAHTTAQVLINQRRFSDVVEVLTPVASLDATAFDLRSTLVGALAMVGARDAAQAHYRSMAAAHERDLGLPVKPYDELVQDVQRVV